MLVLIIIGKKDMMVDKEGEEEDGQHHNGRGQSSAMTLLKNETWKGWCHAHTIIL